MKTNVGELRHQSAYCDGDRPVVIVTDDPSLKSLNLSVVEFYPDTTDQYGGNQPTFKIQVKRNDR